LAWVGCYFGDGGNGSYTRVLGSANTVAGANAYLNALNWYVCDGAAVNVSGSPIFDGAGRYLPNLTDDRFIMGDTVVGGLGGENTNSHTHAVGSIAAANESTHTHGVTYTTTDSGNQSVTHTHPVSGTTGAEASHKHAYVAGVPPYAASGATTGAGSSHSHGDGTLAAGNASTGHSHGYGKTNSPTNAGSAHSHSMSGSTAAPSDTDNKPVYLGLFYIMRVL